MLIHSTFIKFLINFILFCLFNSNGFDLFFFLKVSDDFNFRNGSSNGKIISIINYLRII